VVTLLSLDRFHKAMKPTSRLLLIELVLRESAAVMVVGLIGQQSGHLTGHKES
jgi:hypothetical protein